MRKSCWRCSSTDINNNTKEHNPQSNSYPRSLVRHHSLDLSSSMATNFQIVAAKLLFHPMELFQALVEEPEVGIREGRGGAANTAPWIADGRFAIPSVVVGRVGVSTATNYDERMLEIVIHVIVNRQNLQDVAQVTESDGRILAAITRPHVLGCHGHDIDVGRPIALGRVAHDLILHLPRFGQRQLIEKQVAEVVKKLVVRAKVEHVPNIRDGGFGSSEIPVECLSHVRSPLLFRKICLTGPPLDGQHSKTDVCYANKPKNYNMTSRYTISTLPQ